MTKDLNVLREGKMEAAQAIKVVGEKEAEAETPKEIIGVQEVVAQEEEGDN